MTKENKNNTLTRSMKFLKNAELSRSSLGATTTPIITQSTSEISSETSITLVYNVKVNSGFGLRFSWDLIDFTLNFSSPDNYYYKGIGRFGVVPNITPSVPVPFLTI